MPAANIMPGAAVMRLSASETATAKIEAVPATSVASPGSSSPEASADCIVSPAPAAMGMPDGSPIFSASSGQRKPTISHGLTIRGNISIGMPSAFICRLDQLRSLAS
ncbi:hypothetical protein SDC9_197354 [bioreactor metagenome]|uniref:Uncharacterized protein n=1 Tax=bioreactor metagenome TaxID=1076179 RepID=A0A645IFX6_9ZZZZ